ncbi:hypothetical protein [Pigmentiphaga sp.]|uniref:hypothetical protein n=1 Tax=Pigmentiphaga sp. TaxID=1977564 RepID=UPI00128D68BA|nr:hypothetical protein [Pigmentiphaga sp.]MPS27178.1 hypothetical protein [Alcaligenaceae bacterium SAGV5]MPS51733.1 hypothetical protein [Alcaligenaceae bacterium SAGV3]MPT58520.1 hypothetical protein [Alcaligenaceae bacterium]
MTDTIAKLLRTAFVAGIALVGMIMAAILLASTAVALTIVYVVAKLRGKPFVANTYWKRSQTRWGFGENAGGGAAAAAPARSTSGYANRMKRSDIVDVEVRDVMPPSTH